MDVQSVSNLLSIITIAACFVQKIPQIITLNELKSASGISTLSLLMELTR